MSFLKRKSKMRWLRLVLLMALMFTLTIGFSAPARADDPACQPTNFHGASKFEVYYSCEGTGVRAHRIPVILSHYLTREYYATRPTECSRTDTYDGWPNLMSVGGIEYLPSQLFEPACHEHDMCYASGNTTKADCDSAFYSNMSSICILFFPAVNINALKHCTEVVNLLYAGVKVFGKSAYDEGQTRFTDDIQSLVSQRWHYWRVKQKEWKSVPARDIPIEDLRFGHFDSDDKTDVFTRDSDGWWKYASGGTGNWQRLMNSGYALERLRFGDFNGDGETDVFVTSSGRWYYSASANSPWVALARSSYAIEDLGFGDFDGDGHTDVFSNASSGRWQFSSGGSNNWEPLDRSSWLVRDLRFGDFDGDGATDVFAVGSSGRWQFSSGGAGSWQRLARADELLPDLRFGDFDGDGLTDVFTIQGTRWRVSYGGTNSWTTERTTSAPGSLYTLGFGDFDGDGATDVFVADRYFR